MRTLRVIDFETTGLPPYAGIIEVGWTDVFIDNVISMEPVWHGELTNPGTQFPIQPDAEKVHGISMDMIKDARHPMQVLEELEHVDAFVAHNAKFERGFFKTTKPWIDTLKAARQFITDAPAYNNTALRNHLNLDLKEGFNPAFAMPAHRAGPDTYVTGFLLMEILNRGATFDALVELSGKAQLVEICSYKKWAGTPWRRVPSDYMRWLRGLPNLDEDIAFTIEHWLRERGDLE